MTPTNPWMAANAAESPTLRQTVWANRFRKTSLALGVVTILLGSLCFLDSLLARLPDYTGLLWLGPSCQSSAIGLVFILTGFASLAPRLLRGTSSPVRTPAALQSLLGVPVLLFGALITSSVPIPIALVHDIDMLTGWIFFLLGCALLLEGIRIRPFGYARQLALFAAFFFCGLVLVGYAFEIGTHQTGMAEYLDTPWSTALMGVVAAHALLYQHPNFGAMRLLSGREFGSHMLRRLIPPTVLLLGGLGWILAYGKGHGWFPAAFGEGLFAILAVTGFSGVLLATTYKLNRLDDERSQREKDLKRNQDQLRAVLDNAGAIICMKDTSGRYMLVNESFSRLTGMARKEAVGKTAADIFPEVAAQVVEEGHHEALRTRAPVERVDHVPYAGGNRSYLSVNIPLADAEGSVYAVCGIYTDVTELHQQTQEIHRLNESLVEETRRQAEANHELEAFSYSVSHDLRAPLRHIAGFAQLLSQRNKDRLDEKSLHYVGVILESVNRMGMLIDDLLAFSRAGKVELSRRRVRTADLVREVRDEIMTQHSGPPVEWHIGELPDMHGDPSLLRQVWSNLLSNAVKYSSKRENPLIEVEHGPIGDVPSVFTVRDNGAGFDMQYVDKLFGVFQRLHSGKDFHGTGIGLALVRRILERHGGRIWAEASPDAGACFYFVIPGLKTANAADTAAEEGAA